MWGRGGPSDHRKAKRVKAHNEGKEEKPPLREKKKRGKRDYFWLIGGEKGQIQHEV